MSDQGPKNKNTDSKIKFFKIDPEGDIAPAFPKDGDIPVEPSQLDTLRELTGSFPNINLNLPPADSGRSEAIEELKPQVEDISNLPDDARLSTDQADVLKKYIAVKESEVRDLSDQHRQYEGFLKKITSQLETQTNRNRDLLSEMEVLRRREEHARAELKELRERHEDDVVRLKSDFEEKIRLSGGYEEQVEELHRKREEWKEKVKEDLKRIKLKERELENKYELLKRDMQALLESKDKHVLELKKKNDALELEMESLEDRLRQGNSVLGSIDSKKKRLIETMRLAITLLEDIDRSVDADDDQSRKAG